MLELANLEIDSLRDAARNLLLGRGEAVALIDQRRHELPYRPLLESYDGGKTTFRSRLRRALVQLLDDAAREPWDVDALGFLLTTVEETASKEAIEPLQRLVGAGAWLRQPEGKFRHMLALRTLLGLGWLGQPSFWLREHARLEGTYPELVFRALASHDLGIAFANLTDLAQSEGSARKITLLFPSLIERHGLEAVRHLASRYGEQLELIAQSIIERWFRDRDYGSTEPLRANKPSKNVTDREVGDEKRLPASLELNWLEVAEVRDGSAVPTSIPQSVIMSPVVPEYGSAYFYGVDRVLNALTKELRASRRIVEIEKQVGRRRGYFSKVSAGKRRISINLLMKTLEILNLDPAEFFARALAKNQGDRIGG